MGEAFLRLANNNHGLYLGSLTCSRQEVSLRASQRHLVNYGAAALRGLLLGGVFGCLAEYEIGAFSLVGGCWGDAHAGVSSQVQLGAPSLLLGSPAKYNLAIPVTHAVPGEDAAISAGRRCWW